MAQIKLGTHVIIARHKTIAQFTLLKYSRKKYNLPAASPTVFLLDTVKTLISSVCALDWSLSD